MNQPATITPSKELSPSAKRMIKYFSRFNAWVFRKSGGRLLGSIKGQAFCVVTMKGAKSGKVRYVPLMYVPHKDGVILVASLGGAPKHPVWYYNLVANPEITVLIKGKLMQLVARQVSPEEKTALWPICCKYYSEYENYQLRTTRDIPVFECLPAGPAS